MVRSLLLMIFICTSLSVYAQKIDSLERIIALGKNDSSHVVTLARLAQFYRGKENQKVLQYSREILRLSEVYPIQTAKTYVTIGLIFAEQGSYDSALIYLQHAQEISNKMPGDAELKSVLFNGFGLFHKRKGNNEEALKYYFAIDSLGEKGVGKENIAGNRLNLAHIYLRMGDRREAISHVYQALTIFESIQHKKGMSYCYNSLGGLLKLQQEFDKSAYYLQKSLEMKEGEGDTRGIATSCNELALLYMDQLRYDEAIAMLERAMDLAKKNNFTELLANAAINKAKVLRLSNRFDEAASTLDIAKAFVGTPSGQFSLAQYNTEHGKLLSEKSKYKEAIEVLLASIDQAERSSNVGALLNAHTFIIEAYEKNNQHKEALSHFKIFHKLNDSINGQQIKLDYKRLETQYEVAKKNAEIALLKKDQEIQSRIAERHQAIQTVIATALISVIIISLLLINRYRVVNRTKRLLEIERVRNTIARDLHDDIGSTVSSINIVSQMALHQDSQNGHTIDTLRKISEQSSAMMERMSDIVWSINPENDSLPRMASRMKEFTAEILEPKNIQYTFNGEQTLNGEVLDVDKRKNIFLIFKEAINNAAKYSGGSEVNISFSQKDHALFLDISDNGKGFDINNIKRGNGLRNMKERAAAINASLEVESHDGAGTHLKVRIPIT